MTPSVVPNIASMSPSVAFLPRLKSSNTANDSKISSKSIFLSFKISSTVSLDLF